MSLDPHSRPTWINRGDVREVYPLWGTLRAILLGQELGIIVKQRRKVAADERETKKGDLERGGRGVSSGERVRQQGGRHTVFGATVVGQRVTNQFQKGVGTNRDTSDLV